VASRGSAEQAQWYCQSETQEARAFGYTLGPSVAAKATVKDADAAAIVVTADVDACVLSGCRQPREVPAEPDTPKWISGCLFKTLGVTLQSMVGDVSLAGG
jgi:hypothetical protein